MPWVGCLEPGCPELLTDEQALKQKRRCREHYKEENAYQHSRTRSPGREQYASNRWRILRKKVLERDGFLCQQCLKEDRANWGDQVDHIVPIHRGGDRWDMDNLQTLCRSCHATKSASERGPGPPNVRREG